MPRFFVDPHNIEDGKITLEREDAEHIKVIRMRPGENFIACDGRGLDYLCSLEHCDGRVASAEILDSFDCPAEPSVHCTVFAAFPKGDRSDYIVQKCTEVGAAEIVFFPSECTVSRPDPKSLGKKLIRWQKIAKEAAKQSGRGRVPTLSSAETFKMAVSMAAVSELPLMMYELSGSQRRPLRQVLESVTAPLKTAAIITGAEGGFTQQEADYAMTAGLHLCSMGPRILRCETAPVIAVGALMYSTGNLD